MDQPGTQTSGFRIRTTFNFSDLGAFLHQNAARVVIAEYHELLTLVKQPSAGKVSQDFNGFATIPFIIGQAVNFGNSPESTNVYGSAESYRGRFRPAGREDPAYNLILLRPVS